MKKVLLFVAALLLIGTTAQATDQKHSDQQDRVINRYQNSQPIIFVENGVKFFVYPKGTIDFKILRKRSRHVNWNSSNGFNSPGGYYGYDRSYQRAVRYDYYGRLKKVGSNYISHDRYNRTRRIGSISIRYNRRGLVYQIGGLHIFYNRYGSIKYVEGNVHNTGCGYCGIDGCTITHEPYFNQNWKQPRHYDKHNNDDDDDDHYYKNRKRKKRYNDDDDDD